MAEKPYRQWTPSRLIYPNYKPPSQPQTQPRKPFKKPHTTCTDRRYNHVRLPAPGPLLPNRTFHEQGRASPSYSKLPPINQGSSQIIRNESFERQTPFLKNIPNTAGPLGDGLSSNFQVMKTARENPQVISLCPDNRLLDNLRECNKLLDQVQKGLSEYLETKRMAFPRFYFLSDDELLEILSQTKDPTAVQPHLRKCFENIARLKFEDDLEITSMFSGEGEQVAFEESLYPTGNVEEWMLEIEKIMRESLRRIIERALKNYKEIPRTEWVLSWPGQVVIAGCQTYWSSEVTEALEQGNIKDLYQVLLQQLDGLRELVRGDLTKTGRMTLSALIVIEVSCCFLFDFTL